MDDNFPIGSCLGLILLMLFLVGMGYLIAVKTLIDGTPTAMDVYQGKTTLEYTVVNGIKIDSCVIWKKE